MNIFPTLAKYAKNHGFFGFFLTFFEQFPAKYVGFKKNKQWKEENLLSHLVSQLQLHG
jgi:hypothetical protein